MPDTETIWEFIERITDTTLQEKAPMKDDKHFERIRKDVERDITRFKDSGRLPQERDVQYGSETSPYWDWVEKNGGEEPLFNSGNSGDDELHNITRAPGTSRGTAFAAWRATDFYDLPYQDQELFIGVWEEGLSPETAGSRVGLSKGHVYKRLGAIRHKLSLALGINTDEVPTYYKSSGDGTICNKPASWSRKQKGAE